MSDIAVDLLAYSYQPMLKNKQTKFLFNDTFVSHFNLKLGLNPLTTARRANEPSGWRISADSSSSHLLGATPWQLAKPDANVSVSSLTQLRHRRMVCGCFKKPTKSKAPPAKEAP